MKHLLFIFHFIFLPASVFSQFIDSFSDGNFSENPVWTGDTAHFEVNSLNQLRLQNTGPDTSFMVTANTRVTNTEWDFWLKMSFNTSANNFSRIYLVSDQENLLGSLNGYFLQAGGSLDSLFFFKQSGSDIHLLFKGINSFTGNSTNIFRIKVIHDEQGIWHLYSDPAGGNNLIEEGSFFDNSISVSAWSGVFCRYTSSNSTKFYFDDFYCGQIITDTISPAVMSVKLTDSLHLEIVFSEPLNLTTSENRYNYSSIDHGTPTKATTDTLNPVKIILTFSDPFEQDMIDTLFIMNIKDLKGNIMQTQGFSIFRHYFENYEILINEIMADPDPPAGLPDCEYVELYNNSNFPADLNGWKLEYSSSSKILPETLIPPRGFFIITKGNFLDQYGLTADLFTSGSTLSNEGTTLTLRDGTGRVIHSIAYENEWYDNPLKDDGGWSLELIDADNPCGCGENWIASQDISGGTPGKMNSVIATNPDIVAPYIKGIRVEGDSAVFMVFSESMDSISSSSHSEWVFEDEIVRNITLVSPGFHELKIYLPYPMINGKGYSISFSGYLSDCAGNQMETSKQFTVALPDSVSFADIIINEVLPDPFSDGERFIEIYNKSLKIVDLKDLVITSYDTIGNSLTDIKNISEESFLFYPGDYLVLTNNYADIKTRYYCPEKNLFLVISSLPSMSNDYGHLAIARKYDGLIIDRMKYTAEMHFPLIIDGEGISLEKISPSGTSMNAGTWHSASFSCGYATPGYRNSQYLENENEVIPVSISPAVFSPDNDGVDDIVEIKLNGTLGDCLSNILIFDNVGRMVRRISNNSITAPNDIFYWDGTDESRKRVSTGIYIVFAEIVLREGEVKRWKIPVVVASKL